MSLAVIGLDDGAVVRFRPPGGGRWKTGVAIGLEGDGSLSIRDTRGAFRAIPFERVEVQTRGRRGGRRWEPLLDRAARVEQLRLL